MQEIRSSNLLVVTGTCDPSKSRALHHHSLKLSPKLIYLNMVLLLSFSTCATMEWMTSAQWKITSTYQRSTITMKRNRSRDMFTVLLVVLLIAREDMFLKIIFRKIYPNSETHFFCFSFISMELFFYLSRGLT